MRPEPKKRLATSGAQPPLGHLEDALAGVDFSGLMPGAEGRDDAAGMVPPSEPTPAPLWKPGRVVLRREKAHRGGKTVVVVEDFATHLPLSVIENVARRLRAACGSGGAVKGRSIEIQGDQPAKVRAALEAEGFQVGGVR